MPNEIYKFLRIRLDETHERLIAQSEERASQLTGARLQPNKQGSFTLGAALCLKKLLVAKSSFSNRMLLSVHIRTRWNAVRQHVLKEGGIATGR